MPMTADAQSNDNQQPIILLVDDEPINRQVLHNYLSLQNYQLVEAADGKQLAGTIKNLRTEIRGIKKDTGAAGLLENILGENLQKQLPVYTKTPKSKSQFCAGYYIICFEKGWRKAYCPKMITLSRYKYKGPMKTKLEMQQVLNNAVKEFQDTNKTN